MSSAGTGRLYGFDDVPLVGRDEELAVLGRMVERLAAGRGSVVLIEGEAGTGKSRLLDTATATAATLGVRCARARTDVLAKRRPFHVALELAQDLGVGGASANALGELLDTVRQRSEPVALAPPGSARVAVIEAMIAELEAIAVTPIVLAIEDLHWSDDASLAALRAVLPLTAELPLLVLATTRPQETLAVLHTEMGRLGEVIRTRELTPAESTLLVTRLLGSPPGPGLMRVVERASGNPFMVTELVRSLDERRWLVVGDGVVELTVDNAHAGAVVADTLTARFTTLGDDVLALLRPAAVIGASFSVRDVAALTGRPAADHLHAVDVAVAAGLLVPDGNGLRFQHDLLRESVYNEMPVSACAALHDDMAGLLARRGSSPVAIATHAALGAAPTDAAHWLYLAASDIVGLSPESALSMLDDALGMGIEDPAVLVAIQRARVESLMGVGRLDDAALLAERMLTTMPAGDERSSLLTRLAGILVLLNRTGEAVVHLEEAARDARSPGEQALAMAQGALALMAQSDLDGAADLAVKAAAHAEATGERSARTIAASVLGRLPCFTHGYADGLAAALTAVEGADADVTGRAHDYVPWFWAGLIALDLDDFSLVDRALREGRRRADDGYASWAHPLYAGLAASTHFRRGRLDECRAEAETGISLSIDTGSSQARLWCESLRALAAELEGDVEARREYVASAEATWATTNALLGIDHFALAQTLGRGPDEVVDHLTGAWELFEVMGARNCQPLLAVPLARAARASGHSALRTVSDSVEQVARATALDGFVALAAHVGGLAECSVERLERAAEVFESLGRRVDAAEARADAARVSAELGDPRARSLNADAVAAFRGCGAEGAARALEAELGPAATTTVARPVFGWESLTPTEREVATLVGQAKTNSQIAAERFVSRRTVESQLRSIYTKLGYSSRTRLAMEAADLLAQEPG